MGIVPWFTRLAGRAQSGYLFHYAFAMVLGLVLLTLWLGLGSGAVTMNSLLSLVTFLPLIGAVVLLVFLRGEDALAQKNAKLLALFTTTATFLLSLFVLLRASTRRTPASSSSRSGPGSAGSPTRWASTASRCCS